MEPFKGFNQNQQFKLLKGMGYAGNNELTEMDKFLQATPAAAVKLGKYAQKAAERINKIRGYAEGGLIRSPDETEAQWQARVKAGGGSSSTPDPTNPTPTNKTTDPEFNYDTPQKVNQRLQKAQQNFADAQIKGEGVEAARKQLEEAQAAYATTNVLSADELKNKTTYNPEKFVTPANVAQVAQEGSQEIAEGTGQATRENEAEVSTVGKTSQAKTPEKFDAGAYDATTASDKIKAETEALTAATGAPSAAATVRGQLEGLMKDFEGGETPPWASGAMRNAMALMQQRGMGASSMAGQAVVQAAMESAISIASQDAQTNAAFEMKNLDNEQQTAIFKSQQNIASIFTDQAADNAAKQFNAASENQVNQFFADMEATISRFNSDQINSIRQFNSGQENAIEQFNTSLKAQRDQFNATNDLVIAQANAKWRQTISMADTQAQNDANLLAAQAANGLTARGLDHIWQQERDIMAFAFQSAENAEDRAHELLVADKGIRAEKKANTSQAIGYIAGKLLFG